MQELQQFIGRFHEGICPVIFALVKNFQKYTYKIASDTAPIPFPSEGPRQRRGHGTDRAPASGRYPLGTADYKK